LFRRNGVQRLAGITRKKSMREKRVALKKMSIAEVSVEKPLKILSNWRGSWRGKKRRM